MHKCYDEWSPAEEKANSAPVRDEFTSGDFTCLPMPTASRGHGTLAARKKSGRHPNESWTAPATMKTCLKPALESAARLELRPSESTRSTNQKKGCSWASSPQLHFEQPVFYSCNSPTVKYDLRTKRINFDRRSITVLTVYEQPMLLPQLWHR